MGKRMRWAAMGLVAVLAACGRGGETRSETGGAAGAPVALAKDARAAGQAQELGSLLAYEHSAEVVLDATAIPARLQAVRQACDGARFGACVVLSVQQSGGELPSGVLGMRIVPAGVEPMIALASEGARLGSRSTHAEDLAVVVRDNATVQARLRTEMARLQEFQQRGDLAVADMIALSRQLAETEAQLQAAEQEGAQHRRRIDTQLLTLNFRPPGGEAGRSEIAQALRDFGGTLSMGTAWTIRAAAFLIPLLLAVAVLVAGVRAWRRRRRG